nr:ATP synthase F0 subunit 8 [Fundulus majalis]
MPQLSTNTWMMIYVWGWIAFLFIVPLQVVLLCPSCFPAEPTDPSFVQNAWIWVCL